MTVPEEAIPAAEATLRAFLEPWLDFTCHGTPLRDQIHTAAAIAVRDAAPAIRSQAIAEGVALERQRLQDAASMPGYVAELERRVTELGQIARDMFACIDDADYPPFEHIELWRAILARTPALPGGPGVATSHATAATPAHEAASRTEPGHAPAP